MSDAKRPPGRPAREAEAVRSLRVLVRLTSGEREELAGRAEISHRTLASYVREGALRSRVVAPKVPEPILRAIGDLNRLGNNLNQLVRLIHSGEVAEGLGGVLIALLASLEAIKAELLRSREVGP